MMKGLVAMSGTVVSNYLWAIFPALPRNAPSPPQEIKKIIAVLLTPCIVQSLSRSPYLSREEQKTCFFPHARCTPFIFEFPRLIPADSVHILHLQSPHLESQSSILPQGEPQRLRRKQEHYFEIIFKRVQNEH